MVTYPQARTYDDCCASKNQIPDGWTCQLDASLDIFFFFCSFFSRGDQKPVGACGALG